MLYRDEHCMVFADKCQTRAAGHYQCIPRRHIMNLTHLKLGNEDRDEEPTADYALMKHMEAVGLQFLSLYHTEEVDNGAFRIGFHPPGRNSQHHLHLHLIVEPIATEHLEQVHYGTGLIRIHQVKACQEMFKQKR